MHKSIYGLKQASRQWFTKFSSALLCHGFSQSKADYSLFTRGFGDSFIAFFVYVDDILITGPSYSEIDSVKQNLYSHFMLNDLGSVKYLLSLELSRSKDGDFLSQRKYCLQILEDTSFLGVKPISLPVEPNLRLSASFGIPFLLLMLLHIGGLLANYYIYRFPNSIYHS